MLIWNILTTLISILSNEKGNLMEPGGSAEGGGAAEGGEGGGAAEGGEGGGPEVKYPEGFDDALKGNPAFNAFINNDGDINHANLMKSYAHQQKLIGSDKMVVPNENFTDDQWKETFTKLGLPEDLSEYSIENNIPEGITANDKMFDDFKALAHKSGLLPKQAQSVLDFYNSAIGEDVKAQQAAAIEAHTAQVDGLKKEWGEKFEHNRSVAYKALEEFADKDEVAALRDAGYLNDPKLTKLFQKIGENLAMEDNDFNDLKNKDFGMDADDIDKEVREMYSKDHPYMNRKNPDHAKAVQRFQLLMAKKVKLEGRDPNALVIAG